MPRQENVKPTHIASGVLRCAISSAVQRSRRQAGVTLRRLSGGGAGRATDRVMRMDRPAIVAPAKSNGKSRSTATIRVVLSGLCQGNVEIRLQPSPVLGPVRPIAYLEGTWNH